MPIWIKLYKLHHYSQHGSRAWFKYWMDIILKWALDDEFVTPLRIGIQEIKESHSLQIESSKLRYTMDKLV